MNNSHKTAQIVRNPVPLFPVWVHWFFQLCASIRRGSKGAAAVCPGKRDERTAAQKTASSLHTCGYFTKRAQMKGRDCNAAASATLRKLHTGSEAISDDDMVSSLLWSTARPDADTWPARSGALFNHLELKRCTFDKERHQDAQTISVLPSKPDLICHKRSPRRNYYMQHLLQSWEHISKHKINRALLICKVLVKKTKCSFKQKHNCSVSCHCMDFMRESVWHIQNARQ